MERDQALKRLQDAFERHCAIIEDNIPRLTKQQQIRVERWLEKIRTPVFVLEFMKIRNQHSRMLAQCIRTGTLFGKFAHLPDDGPLTKLDTIYFAPEVRHWSTVGGKHSTLIEAPEVPSPTPPPPARRTKATVKKKSIVEEPSSPHPSKTEQNPASSPPNTGSTPGPREDMSEIKVKLRKLQQKLRVANKELTDRKTLLSQREQEIKSKQEELDELDEQCREYECQIDDFAQSLEHTTTELEELRHDHTVLIERSKGAEKREKDLKRIIAQQRVAIKKLEEDNQRVKSTTPVEQQSGQQQPTSAQPTDVIDATDTQSIDDTDVIDADDDAQPISDAGDAGDTDDAGEADDDAQPTGSTDDAHTDAADTASDVQPTDATDDAQPTGATDDAQPTGATDDAQPTDATDATGATDAQPTGSTDAADDDAPIPIKSDSITSLLDIIDQLISSEQIYVRFVDQSLKLPFLEELKIAADPDNGEEDSVRLSNAIKCFMSHISANLSNMMTHANDVHTAVHIARYHSIATDLSVHVPNVKDVKKALLSATMKFGASYTSARRTLMELDGKMTSAAFTLTVPYRMLISDHILSDGRHLFIFNDVIVITEPRASTFKYIDHVFLRGATITQDDEHFLIASISIDKSESIAWIYDILNRIT